MRFAVLPNLEKPQSKDVLARLVAFAKKNEVELLLERRTADYFNFPELGTDNLMARSLDLAISVGGDGTLLTALRRLYSNPVPACGINIGTVGFLADIELAEIEVKLTDFINGKWWVEERHILAGKVMAANGTKLVEGHAVNDIVITKGASARMLHIGLSVAGDMVGVYKADGMIISSATGSTAYSLSAGGPIMHPSVNALVVTPICPHTFTARPMVVPDTHPVGVHITAPHQDIQVAFDSHENFALRPGDMVEVTRADTPLQIVRFEDKSYYSTLSSKLWNNI